VQLAEIPTRVKLGFDIVGFGLCVRHLLRIVA